MEFSDTYLTPLDNFFKDLIYNTGDFLPTIYLFDLDNEHGKDMYYLIKNPLFEALQEINIEWIKITSIEDFSQKLQEQNWKNDNSVICIPFSWNLSTSKFDINIIEKIYLLSRNHPVIIAAGDEYFNKTFDFCFLADKSITWGTNINNEDKTITGTSAYACFLAILALRGINDVQKYKRIIDYL